MASNQILIPLLSKAWEVFFDSESDIDGCTSDRRNIAKNFGFWENTVPWFDDKQFKEHFRLSSTSFEEILKGLHATSIHSTDLKPGRPPADFEKKVLITLWYLANMECFRSVADRFGVSIRICWNAVHIICKNILQSNKEYQFIAWPNEVRAEQIADYHKRKTGFPGIFGCIDVTHIPIPAPKEHPNSYINRKNFHSVLLQVVCDEKMMFTDCYTGEVGSIHDSCSLKIPYEQHMLGDQGYGLKTYLMIPYKDNGHLSERQKLFNHTLSSNQVVVETDSAVFMDCKLRNLT